MEHGTVSNYTSGGCRCDSCREAATVYNRRKRLERQQAKLAPNDSRHGSINAYGNYGCRCRPCKDAAAAVARERAYGISQYDWDVLFDEQDHRCACCGHDDSRNGKGWATDHDHETGKVRGILCVTCNVALGMMKDDPARIALLLEYAQRHQAPGF